MFGKNAAIQSSLYLAVLLLLSALGVPEFLSNYISGVFGMLIPQINAEQSKPFVQVRLTALDQPCELRFLIEGQRGAIPLPAPIN